MRPAASAGWIVLAGVTAAASSALWAQEWTTSGVDAQRSSWVRSDDRLTKAAVADGTFAFLWKAEFDNRTRGPFALTPPVLLDRLIGYRGFKALAFVGGSSDRIFAIDTDLNKPYWQVQLNYSAATGGPPPITPECPGALTATPARRTALVQPAFAPGAGGARAGARSAVGEPGRGAAVMSQPPRGRGPAGPTPAPAQSARGARGRGRVTNVPFGGVDPLYVVGIDGFLRILRTSDGTEVETGVPFIPPGAMASTLIFVDGAVYTTTSNGCGVSPNGVWMIDTTAPDRPVTSWHTGGPNVIGRAGLALGTDGTVFVAVGPVPPSAGRPAAASVSQFADSIVALDGSTLAVKDWFTAPGAKFNTSPMVVRHDNRDLVFAAADDGRLYVLDGGSLGGSNHRTPLHVTSPYSDAGAAGSLTTWQAQGTRWVLGPSTGAPKPGLAFAANGPAPNGRIVAFKLTGTGASIALEPAWASRNLAAPLGPIVVNGVVFAAAAGNRSTRAVLYALDGDTGRELWTSRTAIASFAQGELAAGAGQVYLVTNDNSLYAFGIPMEH
jgi:hypothetical protein